MFSLTGNVRTRVTRNENSRHDGGGGVEYPSVVLFFSELKTATRRAAVSAVLNITSFPYIFNIGISSFQIRSAVQIK